MKKLISLVLVLCMFFSITTLNYANINFSNYAKGFNESTPEQLEKFVILDENGTLILDKIEAEENGHEKADVLYMENIVKYINKKIENDELIVGRKSEVYNKESQPQENQPESWSPTPIVESSEMEFCLSKSRAYALRNDLQDRGLSYFELFLASYGESGVELTAFGGKLAFTIGVLLGYVTMYGTTDDLEDALNDAAWEMNNDDYVIVTANVEHVWNKLSDWYNEEAPDEVNYNDFIRYEITDQNVSGEDLEDYL
ncbi:hypothetical protein F8154_06595 [Alkaliphilus pronyensis]|uniref:Uncharacterized protein n=1 Tax=Alkaliphilus pronyensis TaxID=1482732 RepID=A0A6I0F0Q0_9FIRM|nr:hypothetical protein [Alkaliphilus pronyensis]KAB3535447.1 hypothetical protein F8154_06595 [Alkaliphilus pronyensis]